LGAAGAAAETKWREEDRGKTMKIPLEREEKILRTAEKKMIPGQERTLKKTGEMGMQWERSTEGRSMGKSRRNSAYRVGATEKKKRRRGYRMG
jgi:hypothetical protein